MAAKVLAENGEVDAVPAHRGMVYVVFERMPLEAFNNRIPPITAEIGWSAETPAVVRNALFAPHGSYSFQRDGFATDFRRGLLYLEGDGLHRIPTSTMTVISDLLDVDWPRRCLGRDHSGSCRRAQRSEPSPDLHDHPRGGK